MAYKRRFNKKKTNFKRKRAYRPRLRAAPRLTYATPKMIYKATLQGKKTSIICASNTSFVLADSFSFGDIIPNDIDAFGQLYDEIKLTAVRISILPRGNVANAGLTQEEGFRYYSVIDYSDDNILPDVETALQYATCRTHSSWKPMNRFVSLKQPIIVKDVNNTNMLQTQSPQWLQILPQTIVGIPIVNASVAHLGIKIISEKNESAEDVIFDVYTKFYCLFRNKN